MSSITRRLSVPELSRQVLEMAKTGVYRESIFVALQPLSTKKNIRLAIAHAKQFGLHSVAELRDEALGTYYQVDLAQYHASQGAFDGPVAVETPTDAIQLATDLLQAMRWLVRLSLVGAIALAMLGITAEYMNHRGLSGGLLLSALCIGGIWQLQRQIASRFLRN